MRLTVTVLLAQAGMLFLASGTPGNPGGIAIDDTLYPLEN